MTEQSPYATPQANLGEYHEERPVVSQYTVLGLIAGFSFLVGVLDGLIAGTDFYGVWEAATIIMFAGAAVLWYILDCKRRGARHSGGMLLGIVIFMLIAIPIHLFKSRGGWKGALGTLLFLIYIFACGALMSIGTIAVLGLEGF